jgi:riboflavin kinase/FMN adenylyltransferase
VQPSHLPTETDRPVVVLGEFDGFHLGHRQLVDEAARLADRLRRPLVGVVLDDPRARKIITSVEERCWALLASGVSHAIAMTFASPDNPAAGVHAVDEIVERLDPQVIVTACLPGSLAIARYPALRDECLRRGIDVVEVPRWPDPDGSLVTGVRVREALAAGDLVRVNDWLGRTFTLSGTVVHGSGLGRTIGYPTANLSLATNRLVPMNGVYAATVELADGEQHRAAVNIGVRPTVERDGALLVEAHLLDFDGDLYDSRISVGFRRWVRHERRFDSIDELVGQLAADVQQVRLLLRH